VPKSPLYLWDILGIKAGLGGSPREGFGDFPDNQTAGVPLTAGQGAAIEGTAVRFSVAAVPMLAAILFML